MGSPSKTQVSEYVDVTTPHDVNEICEPSRSMELNGSSTENIAAVKTQQQSPVRNDLYEQCIYETEMTAKRQTSSDTLTCPFSGLPATHLELKKSVITGNLHKRRTFFGQVKKYYAGIIEDWLLLYAGGKADLKPTICIALAHCTMHDRSAEIPNVSLATTSTTTTRKPSDVYELQLIQHLPGGFQKKFHFQVNSKPILMDWLTAIQSRLNGVSDFPTQRPHDVTFIASNRKLPTPPSAEMMDSVVMVTPSEAVKSITTTNSFLSSSSIVYGNTRLSNRSEDIYEEPAEMLISHYHQPNETCLENSLTISPDSNLNYDIPKSPPKCIDDGLQCHHDLPANHKFSEVKTKLSTQLKSHPPISISPIKSTITTKGNLSISPSSIKEKPKKGSGESPSPSVKNWFLSRLNKSSATKDAHDQVSIVQPNAADVAPPSKVKASASIRRANGSTAATACTPTKIIESDRSVKGGKVNMIIHQLEANGHLPIFSKTHGEPRRYTQVISYEDESNADDDHNYEPMTITKI